jgi:hypothetical protein
MVPSTLIVKNAAIETRGRAAVETVLGESEPPRYLMVIPLGVERRERS